MKPSQGVRATTEECRPRRKANPRRRAGKRSEDTRDYWTLSSVPFSHSRSCTGSLAYNSMCPQVSHTPMDTGAEYHGPLEADERAKSNSNVPVTLLGCLHLAEAIPVPPLDGLESSTAMPRQRHGLCAVDFNRKARSVYHDATPRFQIVKRVILRIRCCHLQQSGRSQYFHACRCWL